MGERKQYKAIDQSLYNQIKRLLKQNSVKKIAEITDLGRSQIYKIKSFIETNSYDDFAKKKGAVQRITMKSRIK